MASRAWGKRAAWNTSARQALGSRRTSERVREKERENAIDNWHGYADSIR